ncbi:MAG TPA: T9SS type A sorting domain-containing protein [Cytophaga sp.]|jgi:hypothetical protein|nr:T9SS type A sorting domain-containing protein [Cytophaga sp.]
MKHIFLLFFVLASLVARAQNNCNIGNQSSVGYTNPGDPVFKDFLMGIKFTLGRTGTLRSINLIGRNTRTAAKMAVYKDVAGVPGKLIASTAIDTVKSGVISFPVTPTILDSGSYWVMAIYSTTGGHTYSTTQIGATNDSIYYNPQPFSDDIPGNGSDFVLYKDNTTFTYFLGIDCGITAGITEVKNSSVINFYPNPAIDFITINIRPNLIGEAYYITTISGTQVATGQLTDAFTVVDINALQAGIYFMIIGDRERETIKLIKQ